MVTLSPSAIGGTTTLTAVSSLGGTVYFFWFANGVYLGVNSSSATPPAASWTLRPDADEQLSIECYDTTDASYDPATFVSACAPARRTIAWIRSLDATCTAYLIQQQSGSAGSYPVGGSDWETIAKVLADATWQYTFTTEPLDDLTQYAWRVLPLNAAGWPGTPIGISPEMIVRTPEAPGWEISGHSFALL
jgi:hypothetical protein